MSTEKLLKNNSSKIIIVGAGLCGSLLAIRMAQKGFKVVVYERRPDMRLGVEDAGRSINLALSARGLKALETAGIKESILDECIPMRGRMIHPLGGEPFLSPYSGRSDDYINSVSRPGLNLALIKEADKYENVTIKFNTKVTAVDLESAEINYTTGDTTDKDKGTVVIGTDGAGSVVRRSMMSKTTSLLFNYSQDFLRHGYKELSILPSETNSWKIEKEALHIWPNGSFMIIALPNLDGSFTLTMFHPYEGEAGFNTLNTEEKVISFFEKYYPTLLPHIPHLNKEYFENPVGTLGTIKCYPWQAHGKTLIMGDASHAIVPFYGQGMNASLEDVRVFDELMDNFGDDWEAVFKVFEEERVHNTNAIADLAIDNFYEMRDHVDDVAFKRKRKIEMALEQRFPDYYSKYSLVTFNPDLTYSEAKKRGRKQDELLLTLCKEDNYEDIPLEHYHQQLLNLTL
jgi:kynurenine 3-monooxygenase